VRAKEIALCAAIEGREGPGCSNSKVADVVGNGDGHDGGGSETSGT